MKRIILAVAISLSIVSCKNDNTNALSAYNYADKTQVLKCDGVDSKLYSEAYYAFENAILISARNNNRRPNFNITADYALKNFISKSRGNIKIANYITEESLAIFNVLKTQDIWNGTQLKNSSKITECIGTNISTKEIQGSFNSLRSVESLAPNLMIESITGNRAIRGQYKDKALMTYAALDIYYAKFFNTDFTDVKFLTEKVKPTPTQTAITQKKPVIGKPLKLKIDDKAGKKHSPNDGHNH